MSEAVSTNEVSSSSSDNASNLLTNYNFQRIIEGAPFDVNPKNNAPSLDARLSLLGCIGYYLYPAKRWPNQSRSEKFIAAKDAKMRSGFSNKKRTAKLLLDVISQFGTHLTNDNKQRAEYIILRIILGYFKNVIDLDNADELGNPETSELLKHMIRGCNHAFYNDKKIKGRVMANIDNLQYPIIARINQLQDSVQLRPIDRVLIDAFNKLVALPMRKEHEGGHKEKIDVALRIAEKLLSATTKSPIVEKAFIEIAQLIAAGIVVSRQLGRGLQGRSRDLENALVDLAEKLITEIIIKNDDNGVVGFSHITQNKILNLFCTDNLVLPASLSFAENNKANQAVWKEGLKVRQSSSSNNNDDDNNDNDNSADIEIGKAVIIPPAALLFGELENMKVEHGLNISLIKKQLDYVDYILFKLPAKQELKKKANRDKYIFKFSSLLAGILNKLIDVFSTLDDAAVTWFKDNREIDLSSFIKRTHELSYQLDLFVVNYCKEASTKKNLVVPSVQKFVDPDKIDQKQLNDSSKLQQLKTALGNKNIQNLLRHKASKTKLPRTSSQTTVNHSDDNDNAATTSSSDAAALALWEKNIPTDEGQSQENKKDLDNFQQRASTAQLQRRPTLQAVRTLDDNNNVAATSSTSDVNLNLCVSNIIHNAAKGQPFDLEYILLNRIGYGLQGGNISAPLHKMFYGSTIGLTDTVNELYKTCKQYTTNDDLLSRTFADRVLEVKGMIESNDQFNNGINTNNETEYAKKLLQQLDCRQYLPDQYKITDDMDSSTGVFHFVDAGRFHSSTINRSKLWCAHRDGSVVAASGVRPDDSEKRKASFFRMIMAKKASSIIALGAFKGEQVGGPADFAKYIEPGTYKYEHDGKTHSVLVQFQTIPHARTFDAVLLSITDTRTGEQHSVYVNNFVIQDNHPLNFSYNEAITFLSIYNNASENNPAVVHCASGVGRTGMVRVMFKALDELKNPQSRFTQLVDKMLKQGSLVKAEQDEVANTFKQIICSCRKIRYAVQVPEQFIMAVKNVVILRAVQLGFQAEHIKTLRSAMLMPKNLTEIKYGVWDDADLSPQPRVAATAATSSNLAAPNGFDASGPFAPAADNSDNESDSGLDITWVGNSESELESEYEFVDDNNNAGNNQIT